MERLFVSFLSLSALVSLSVSGQQTINCLDRKTQDSLLIYYSDNGSEKLPEIYNNPKWGSYYDSLIAICPNVAAAYQLKAIPYLKNGDWARAFPLEDKAVELDPVQFMGYRGFLKCIFTKDYEGAIIDLKKANEITQDGYVMDHTYFFYQGLCNLELGHYEQAETDLKKDISIQEAQNKGAPVHFNSLLYLGILYYEMKKDSLAEIYLQKTLAIYPQLPEGNYYLARLYKRTGNSEKENEFLSLALKYLKAGYKMNEDNMYYVYYPHQVIL